MINPQRLLGRFEEALKGHYHKQDKSALCVVEHIASDQATYAGILAQHEGIRSLIARVMDALGPHFEFFAEDVFYILYKYQFELRDTSGNLDDLSAVLELHKGLLEQVINSSAFAAMRFYTRGNPFNSAYALAQILEQLLRAFQNPAPPQIGDDNGDGSSLGQTIADALKGAAQSADSMADELNRLKDQLQYLEGMAADKDLDPKARQKIEDLKKKIEAKQQQLQQSLDKLGDLIESSPVEKAVEEALDAAKDSVSKLNKDITQWGVEQGVIQKRPLGSQIDYLKRLERSRLFEKMSDLIGKFRSIAQEKLYKQQIKGYGSITGIEHGMDISNLLPHEVLAHADPVLKREFLSRLYQNKVMQYSYMAEEYAGRGAVVACIDQSGSMDGKKSMYASALALGLAEIAIQQGRPYAALIFSGQGQMVEYRIDGPDLNPETLLDVAETRIGGGTCFETPLGRALEIIEEGDGFSDADIIMITDGEAGISERFKRNFLDKKDYLRIHLYSLLVDVGGYATDSSLKSISDDLFLVSKINQEIAGEIFEKVSRRAGEDNEGDGS